MHARIEVLSAQEEPAGVPAQIVSALVAKLTLYGFWPPSARIPELLRKLEKGYTTVLVR